MKKFSVLLSVYAGEKPDQLEQCLKSLILQTRKANEIILVIDGKIGKRLNKVVKNYRNKLEMTIIQLSQNKVLANALNEGLKKCSNDIIVRMDTDDVCMPDRFSSQVSFMENNPEIAVCSGFVEEWDAKMEYPIKVRKIPLTNEEIVNFSKKRNPISHPAACFRKNIVMHFGGYPEVYPEDYLLWLKLLMSGKKFGNLDKILVKMRTGKSFYKRRGLKFLKGELVIHLYMYRKGWCSFFELIYAVSGRIILRLAPQWIRPLAYKHLR